MTRTTLRGRRGLRSKRAVGHPPAADATAIPSSRSEVDAAHIWAVNSAMESGRTELAYELADRYLRA